MGATPNEMTFEQQLHEALKNDFFAKKNEQQKQDNDFNNAVSQLRAETHIANIIQQIQITREKLLTATEEKERKIHEEKIREYVENINHYYAEKNEASQQMLTDYDQKNPSEKIQALEDALKDVSSQKNKIVQNWTSEEDKNLWLDNDGNIKTWEQGIKAQAAYYAEKAENKNAVLAVANDNIAHIETNGIKLSESEKLQLTEASNQALESFKEELARTSPEQMHDARSRLNLQMKHALLLVRLTVEMNAVIASLNKNREPEAQIQALDPGINRCKAFANENLSTKKNMEQMMTSMQNFMKLQELNTQEKALNQAKNAVSTTPQQIIHCEVKATRTIGYDPDTASRFAIHPYGSNNYNILQNACNEINQENTKPITLEKQANGNIQFHYNNQRFQLDTRTGKFTGDNISPETFQTMMKIYRQVYQNTRAEINTHDPISKNLCDAVIADHNKSAPKQTLNTSLTSDTMKTTSMPEKKTTGEREQIQKQETTPTRRI